MKSLHMIRRILIVLLSFYAVMAEAQTDRQLVRSGNKHFHQQNFVKAEAEYCKALSKKSDNAQALYNLGCALMMQKKDSLAFEQFEAATRVEKSSMRKAMIYHNIGFLYQSHQMYGQAINAYKESLRNNPNDDETRYNLELCKRLNKQNKNRNKDNKQNKQDKKQNKGNNQNKENNKNKDNNKNKNNQQSKAQKDEKLSKDNAEQLLKAAMQEENATRQRIKDSMKRGATRKLDKNW